MYLFKELQNPEEEPNKQQQQEKTYHTLVSQ